VPIKEHQKQKLENKEFYGEIVDESYSQHILSQVYAKSIVFRNVSFKQANLIGCYFRNCRFINCDFTGASIKESNFRGAAFTNCRFSYTIWEKTFIDEEFLESCLPSEENLSRDLVRALRVNFSQIGNYIAVNRAAALEVSLTGSHLYNAAYSRQAYYRDKYKGLDRLNSALGHLKWKSLDLLWGNGERLLKVFVSGIALILLISFWLHVSIDSPSLVGSMRLSLGIFWGTGVSSVPPVIAVVLTVARYVFLGLFMAILVKRLSRR
jgi:hypothetical protein